MNENKKIKISIFKLKEQVAKDARSLVLKDFLKRLTRFLLIMPIVFLIIPFGLLISLLVILGHKILGNKEPVRSIFKGVLEDFEILHEALHYFSKSNLKLIFNIHQLRFKCKKCGAFKNYFKDYYVFEKELPLWQWFNKKRRICYGCYKEETK